MTLSDQPSLWCIYKQIGQILLMLPLSLWIMNMAWGPASFTQKLPVEKSLGVKLLTLYFEYIYKHCYFYLSTKVVLVLKNVYIFATFAYYTLS